MLLYERHIFSLHTRTRSLNLTRVSGGLTARAVNSTASFVSSPLSRSTLPPRGFERSSAVVQKKQRSASNLLQSKTRRNAPLCCIGVDLSTEFTTELVKPERTTAGERTGSGLYSTPESQLTCNVLRPAAHVQKQPTDQSAGVTYLRKWFVLKEKCWRWSA